MKNKKTRKPVFFIDSNVVMYASGSEHRLKQPCINILRETVSEELELRTSVEVIQELLHRFSKVARRDLGIRLARRLLVLYEPILPVQPDDLRLASDLIEKYPSVQSRDAVHAAVSLNNGIRHIISADIHFDTINEIERIDPTEFAGYIS